MKNTMKMTLATVLVAMTAMTMATSASAGVYEEVFARHYEHKNGTQLNQYEIADLAKMDSGSYGYTALAVVAPLYEEIGVIGTALAQNESVHWATLKKGAQLNAQGGWILAGIAADYAIKSQVFDNQARARGYVLKDFTTDVVNLSTTFGTDKAPK